MNEELSGSAKTSKISESNISCQIFTEQFRRLMEDMHIELLDERGVPLSPEEYDAAVLKIEKKALELMEAEKAARKAWEDLAKALKDLRTVQRELNAKETISAGLDFGVSHSSIINRLVEKHHYSSEEAEAFFINYMSKKGS